MALRRSLYVALLGTAAFLLMKLESPPLFAEFLRYDPSGVPALIAAFALGPAAGVAVELVKALLSLMLPTAAGGPFGVFMNFLAGATTAGVAGRYYLRDHTKRGAVAAMGLAVAVTTAVMVAANLLLDPVFYGLTREQVVAFVFPALLPFNLVKGTATSLLTYLVYKRVRVYLRDAAGEEPAW